MWISRQVWKPLAWAEMPRIACIETGRPITIEHRIPTPHGEVAVLTGIQVASIHLTNGTDGENRIAITNIYQQIFGHWKMVLAHTVELHPTSS